MQKQQTITTDIPTSSARLGDYFALFVNDTLFPKDIIYRDGFLLTYSDFEFHVVDLKYSLMQSINTSALNKLSEFESLYSSAQHKFQKENIFTLNFDRQRFPNMKQIKKLCVLDNSREKKMLVFLECINNTVASLIFQSDSVTLAHPIVKSPSSINFCFKDKQIHLMSASLYGETYCFDKETLKILKFTKPLEEELPMEKYNGRFSDDRDYTVYYEEGHKYYLKDRQYLMELVNNNYVPVFDFQNKLETEKIEVKISVNAIIVKQKLFKGVFEIFNNFEDETLTGVQFKYIQKNITLNSTVVNSIIDNKNNNINIINKKELETKISKLTLHDENNINSDINTNTNTKTDNINKNNKKVNEKLLKKIQEYKDNKSNNINKDNINNKDNKPDNEKKQTKNINKDNINNNSNKTVEESKILKKETNTSKENTKTTKSNTKVENVNNTKIEKVNSSEKVNNTKIEKVNNNSNNNNNKKTTECVSDENFNIKNISNSELIISIFENRLNNLESKLDSLTTTIAQKTAKQLNKEFLKDLKPSFMTEIKSFLVDITTQMKDDLIFNTMSTKKLEERRKITSVLKSEDYDTFIKSTIKKMLSISFIDSYKQFLESNSTDQQSISFNKRLKALEASNSIKLLENCLKSKLKAQQYTKDDVRCWMGYFDIFAASYKEKDFVMLGSKKMAILLIFCVLYEKKLNTSFYKNTLMAINPANLGKRNCLLLFNVIKCKEKMFSCETGLMVLLKKELNDIN